MKERESTAQDRGVPTALCCEEFIPRRRSVAQSLSSPKTAAL